MKTENFAAETVKHPSYYFQDAVVLEQTYFETENTRTNYLWDPKQWEEQKENTSITVAVFHIHPKTAANARNN